MTPKQQRFVDEYLLDLNATQAAVRAGYSVKTAEQQGYQLLQKPSVREAVDRALAARSARVQIDADWVLLRLIKLADFDLRDFAWLETVTVQAKQKDGSVVEYQVQEVRFNENFDGKIAGALSKGKDGLKMELPDRVQVLKLIGQHLGMFKEKVEATVEHSGTIDHNHQYDLSNLTDEELMQLEQLTGKVAQHRSH
ncbi:hypothetical protein EL26_22990 [Tumebacillus flagellatus]|uniref:Terminase n=1 Tax=Tumebacillus flagellatus TaxID=1157490 RepID=A0A074LME0_9BACL|nr:hypothetical protein EL26_22990 [Tumebacillus flagellatus]